MNYGCVIISLYHRKLFGICVVYHQYELIFALSSTIVWLYPGQILYSVEDHRWGQWQLLALRYRGVSLPHSALSIIPL